jgi:putative colanic acid biosynthesis glycosyltransferase
MSLPFLSVVTVTKNDYTGLTRTIESLISLQKFQIELIIVDASDDNLIDYFICYPLSGFQNLKIISEPDEGVYYGMNKGLQNATGSYVWFLNGGDLNLLSSIDFINEYAAGSNTPVLLGDYKLRSKNFRASRKAARISKIRHGLPTSHQAILYPREVFQSIMFRTDFKICADYASLADLCVIGSEIQYVDEYFAEFQLDGISGKNQKVLRAEARLIQRDILGVGWVSIIFSSWRHLLTARIRKSVQRLSGLK